MLRIPNRPTPPTRHHTRLDINHLLPITLIIIIRPRLNHHLPIRPRLHHLNTLWNLPPLRPRRPPLTLHPHPLTLHRLRIHHPTLNIILLRHSRPDIPYPSPRLPPPPPPPTTHTRPGTRLHMRRHCKDLPERIHPMQPSQPALRAPRKYTPLEIIVRPAGSQPECAGAGTDKHAEEHEG
ncbi:hypothetical protein BJ508DRAFT_413115 [Ascobolus immersus RN42]|uniref:Uncharacterized protein n=1 Tax=Ascobolus immersus RN42 TaxID=1160509 RepID=A0A3N4ICD6_ASCIM|nr:hypothetical protein BJ508DRAFT_413115 [Ascobolus immersus RN42]